MAAPTARSAELRITAYAYRYEKQKPSRIPCGLQTDRLMPVFGSWRWESEFVSLLRNSASRAAIA